MIFKKKIKSTKQDTIWMLSLYGTAIGAGVLFLPINAGLGGLWPLVAMLLLAYPMTYFAHQNLCRFVLSGSSQQGNVTEVATEHFGEVLGGIIAVLYFLAIWPIVLMYAVALTNTTDSFIVHQLGFSEPSRGLLAFCLIASLMFIVYLGQEIIVKAMSLLVFPFIIILLMLSLSLIPHWGAGLSHQSLRAVPGGGSHSFLMTLWLIIPVIVFSFNHSPIISSFAIAQKQAHGEDADKNTTKIMQRSHVWMVLTVMFFVVSCVLSLSPANLLEAKQQNISILSYLANHFHSYFFSYVGPIVAFVAIIKSFLGHYLGANEGLKALILKISPNSVFSNNKVLAKFIVLFMLCSCWLVATLNPSILGMIEMLGGPVIALYLFLMPMVAIYSVPAMHKYRGRRSNLFVGLIGVIAISALLYSMFNYFFN